MKIAIGYKIQKGPWGGGNAFAKSMSSYLRKKGHKVVYDLYDKDIDIILLTDPRGTSPQVTIDAGKIIRYLLFVNKKALVIHRINECDERKGEKSINKLLKYANYVSDHTVFIASWLKTLDLWIKEKDNSVILNGGDKKIFNNENNNIWNGNFPIKIITHHWGGNHQKGMDIYKKIDRIMDDDNWRGKIKFSFVGNIPDNFVFKNINHILPTFGKKLSEIISSHHVYITGSINEPGGMHHIEGALCGLPIIYRNSGSLPEYCKGFGVSFDNDKDVVNSLQNIIKNYHYFKKKMPFYNRSADLMCSEYFDLFNELLNKKFELLGKRNLFKNPWLLLRNQFPF